MIHLESSLFLTYVYSIVFLSSLALSSILVPLCRSLALAYGIVDRPGQRKIHSHPKPYLGGIAVYLSFVGAVFGGLAVLWLIKGSESFQRSVPWLIEQLYVLEGAIPQLLSILVGATAVLAVGLWDDAANSPKSFPIKLAVQIGAAFLAVSNGTSTDLFQFHWLNVMVSVVWIVGIMNSFNLLDNMDGLCSGIAFISLSIFSFIAMSLGQYLVSCILLAMMGSILGFVRYNSYPSSIFLGDAGSLFIGYMIGTMTILESYINPDQSTIWSACMPLMVLAVPLLDTFSVIVIRIKNKKPIYVGDKNHLSHRLVNMGLSQAGAVRLLYAIGLGLGLGALLLPWLESWQAWTLVCQSSLMVTVVCLLMFFGNRTAYVLKRTIAESVEEKAAIETKNRAAS